FGSTVDGAAAGAQTLVVNTSGTTTFTGAVGTTALSSLSSTGTGQVRIGGNVTTSGAGGQSYTGPVVLTGNSVMGAGSAPIFFNSTVDGAAAGAQTLAVNTTG